MFNSRDFESSSASHTTKHEVSSGILTVTLDRKRHPASDRPVKIEISRINGISEYDDKKHIEVTYTSEDQQGSYILDCVLLNTSLLSFAKELNAAII